MGDGPLFYFGKAPSKKEEALWPTGYPAGHAKIG